MLCDGRWGAAGVVLKKKTREKTKEKKEWEEGDREHGVDLKMERGQRLLTLCVSHSGSTEYSLDLMPLSGAPGMSAHCDALGSFLGGGDKTWDQPYRDTSCDITAFSAPFSRSPGHVSPVSDWKTVWFIWRQSPDPSCGLMKDLRLEKPHRM